MTIVYHGQLFKPIKNTVVTRALSVFKMAAGRHLNTEMLLGTTFIQVFCACFSRKVTVTTQRQNECACSGDLRFKRESITNAPLQSPNSHLLPQIFFLLNKICDGGSSKESFLKATTLSILIWTCPREMRTSNGNFTNAAVLPSEIAHA